MTHCTSVSCPSCVLDICFKYSVAFDTRAFVYMIASRIVSVSGIVLMGWVVFLACTVVFISIECVIASVSMHFGLY